MTRRAEARAHSDYRLQLATMPLHGSEIGSQYTVRISGWFKPCLSVATD
jgi:hypothetical protein